MPLALPRGMIKQLLIIAFVSVCAACAPKSDDPAPAPPPPSSSTSNAPTTKWASCKVVGEDAYHHSFEIDCALSIQIVAGIEVLSTASVTCALLGSGARNLYYTDLIPTQLSFEVRGINHTSGIIANWVPNQKTIGFGNSECVVHSY